MPYIKPYLVKIELCFVRIYCIPFASQQHIVVLGFGRSTNLFPVEIAVLAGARLDIIVHLMNEVSETGILRRCKSSDNVATDRLAILPKCQNLLVDVFDLVNHVSDIIIELV